MRGKESDQNIRWDWRDNPDAVGSPAYWDALYDSFWKPAVIERPGFGHWERLNETFWGNKSTGQVGAVFPDGSRLIIPAPAFEIVHNSVARNLARAQQLVESLDKRVKALQNDEQAKIARGRHRMRHVLNEC